MNQEVEVNEQIIIVAAIDADGCALHKNKKGTVVGKNAPLIEHVVATHHTYAETKPKSVKLNGYVTIISNRQ